MLFVYLCKCDFSLMLTFWFRCQALQERWPMKAYLICQLTMYSNKMPKCGKIPTTRNFSGYLPLGYQHFPTNLAYPLVPFDFEAPK
jgi:hypothetical protein